MALSFLEVRGSTRAGHALLLFLLWLPDTSFAFVACRFHQYGASLVAQLVKNLPAKWETWVHSLGWEDPLEKGKATHASILAWRIPTD